MFTQIITKLVQLVNPPLKSADASPVLVQPSVGDVIAEYLCSAEFRCLSPVSQKVYRRMLERWSTDDKLRNRSIGPLDRRDIEATLAPLSQGAANHTFKRVRVLMRFAQARGYRSDDGCNGIKAKPIGREHHTWTDEEIAQYRDRFALGTRERLAFELALGTAQRRTDLARMRWADIRAGRLHVKQSKTGATLSIPLHPDLVAALDRVKGSRAGTILVRTERPRGKALSPESLGNMFRGWITDAGLPDHCVLHGLRKAACRRLAEAGCSEKEIASISGHATLGEVARYTRGASQVRLSDAAMSRLKAA